MWTLVDSEPPPHKPIDELWSHLGETIAWCAERGRILVYGPDEELADGAACEETRGYFDGNNCPPWDTWIALTQFSDGGNGRAAHLFSWVPPVSESTVERGIYVNPEECIQWLEDWMSPGPSTLIDNLRRISGVAR